MFHLSETCFYYQTKLSANQAIRLRCAENFWRMIADDTPRQVAEASFGVSARFIKSHLP
jgi:hypothetical protein